MTDVGEHQIFKEQVAIDLAIESGTLRDRTGLSPLKRRAHHRCC